MSRSLKSVALPLAVLAIVGLFVSMSPIEATSGRDHSRCTRSCNAAERLCKDPCYETCSEMYPGDNDAIGACTGECDRACRDAKHECKIVCNAIKDPTTPEEP